MKGRFDEATVKAALGDLRELPHEPDWRAIEQRLLNVFEEPSLSQAAAPMRSVAWWRWTAAAAVVCLAAAVTFYQPSSRFGAALPKPEGSRPAPPGKATVHPAPADPARSTESVSPAPARPSRRMKPTATKASSPAPQGSLPTFSDFVSLPAAIALPDLESGRIVRVEVPVTLLPAYGLDLVPDAAAAAVQAEFLIGQDGVPRAIRLASMAARDQRP
jgi:hypothetical protein